MLLLQASANTPGQADLVWPPVWQKGAVALASARRTAQELVCPGSSSSVLCLVAELSWDMSLKVCFYICKVGLIVLLIDLQ